jgi:hypothetical protein
MMSRRQAWHDGIALFTEAEKRGWWWGCGLGSSSA